MNIEYQYGARQAMTTASAKINFRERPMVVIWETTQSCDLACVHCRACAQPKASPFELSTSEAEKLIDSIAELRPSVFILTGGDPLKRVDIHYLVSYSVGRGLRPALTPSTTPLLTRSAIHDLKDCGLSRIALSLDGATPEKHDDFRGVQGSFARTMQAIQWSNEVGLPVQINTTVTLRNMNGLEEIAAVLKQMKIVLWSVFFVVPTGRAGQNDLPCGAQFEQIFARLYRLSRELPFHIKTTEAPHYRRFVVQQRMAAMRQINGGNEAIAEVEEFEQRRASVNDGKGFVFISHTGDVFPSGFLPLAVGNVRRTPLPVIYREAPLFNALRDSSMLKGKCGACEFREICGGSRARAYAVTGDPLGQEICCVYQPVGYSAETREPEWAMVGENG